MATGIFFVNTINERYFDSREDLDDFYIPKEYRRPPSSSENIDKISLQDVFKKLNVTVSCNMDYYLKHHEEMEKDLIRKINESELNSPKLEQELLYTLLCKIFGDSEPNNDKLEHTPNDESKFDKVFMLKDFHILSNDYNIIHATAKRGNFYLLLFFAY